MISGLAAAMPLVRNAVTFSACNDCRSSRRITVILVSNRFSMPPSFPRRVGRVLYVLSVGSRERVRAWRPGVPGVAEVFHAHFTEHVYPLHTHDTWTLLIVDRGAVRYDLEHDEHGVLGATVAILPPHVPHNGRSATGAEFRKRVLYLDSDQFGTDLIGRAVDRPERSEEHTSELQSRGHLICRLLLQQKYDP